METFLAMCEWSHLSITSYRSTAQGKLEKVEGALKRVMEKAKRGCLIANSLRTTVTVEVAFEVTLAVGR
jgi:organic hydroperoxide reductase OsmC/OhrA